MKVKLNGKEIVLEGVNSLEDLVASRDLKTTSIAISYNEDVIPKENWPETMLKDNDVIDIVTLMAGG